MSVPLRKYWRNRPLVFSFGLVASVVSAGLALDVPGDSLGVFVTNCRCVGTSICVVARKKRTPGATRDDWDRSAQGHAGLALFDGSAMLAVVTSKTKCREQTSIVAAYTRPADRFVDDDLSLTRFGRAGFSL